MSAPDPSVKFVCGCGLADDYIDFLPSLLACPFVFYSYFISYSCHDDESLNGYTPICRTTASAVTNLVRTRFSDHAPGAA